jgi:hypothetical protein
MIHTHSERKSVYKNSKQRFFNLPFPCSRFIAINLRGSANWKIGISVLAASRQWNRNFDSPKNSPRDIAFLRRCNRIESTSPLRSTKRLASNVQCEFFSSSINSARWSINISTTGYGLTFEKCNIMCKYVFLNKLFSRFLSSAFLHFIIEGLVVSLVIGA